MRDLSLVLAAAVSDVWAIEPRRGLAIAQVLARRSAGRRLSQDEIDDVVAEGRERREAAVATASRPASGVMVIPVVGAIVHRRVDESSFGGTMSMQSLVEQLRKANADPAVTSIVMDVDSPGGSVDGVPEAAAEIIKSAKPVVAVANTWAASAAYWLASQADELVVTPSGEVGSIGVYSLHEDLSKLLEAEGVTPTLVRSGDNKAQTHPYFPLSDAAKADLQRHVDEAAVMFDQAVAKGRGVTAKHVRAEFGQGLMFGAKDAVGRGMADRVATLDETIARLVGGGKVKRRQAEHGAGDKDRRIRELERFRR